MLLTLCLALPHASCGSSEPGGEGGASAARPRAGGDEPPPRGGPPVGGSPALPAFADPAAGSGGSSPVANSTGGGPEDAADACAECLVVPDGFAGPVALFEAELAVMLPSCSGHYGGETTDLVAGLKEQPASCAFCSCKADASCTPGDVTLSPNADCSEGSLSSMPERGCGPLTIPPAGATHLSISRGTGTTVCEPSGGGVSASSPPAFAKSARACGMAAQTLCEPEGLCAASLPDEARLCVFATDTSLPCPAAMPHEVSYSRGYDDGRGCGPCECEISGDTECSYVSVVRANATCGDDGTLSSDTDGGGTSCTPLTFALDEAAVASIKVDFGAVSAATCKPTRLMPEPTGAVTLKDAVKVCCK